MDGNLNVVLVFGTGVSGIEAAKLLTSYDVKTILFDGNTEVDSYKIMSSFNDSMRVALYTGKLSESMMDSVDLLVLSPGVPPDLPLVESFRKKNVPIWGEVELAFRCAKGSLLAITGTNGKTTTTSMVGDIMKRHTENVYVAGNIGLPYSSVAGETDEDSVTVAEISSFQLETIDTFRPAVSAILNITPDHLNRHHTMENYIRAKLDITKNQKPGDVCVLNYEDEILRNVADDIPADIVFFSSARKLDVGFYLDGGKIVYSRGGNITEVIRTDELNVLGTHNYENAMAAAAVAVSYGVPVETVHDALSDFTAVEHRIEFVVEKNGVRYYNDSKGTNPDAAIKAVNAMDRPTLLIGGGYDKDSKYTEWIQSFDGKVKKLVLIGATKEKIAAEAEECGFKDYVFAESLQEAVDICAGSAIEGDAVLLSPACASWDMFPNYEVRGRMFKEMARAVKEKD